MTPAVVAVVGAPNMGKTTLFNALTGQSAKVGNYPGVTVERREGRLRQTERAVSILDVPGTYSLSARSSEEMIALEASVGLRGQPAPDLVLVVADASRPAPTLYLGLQLREMGMRCVIALNFADEAATRPPDTRQIAADLGVSVVLVSARLGKGIDALRDELLHVLDQPAPEPLVVALPDVAKMAESSVMAAIPNEWRGSEARDRALARWALLSLDDEDEIEGVPDGLRRAVDAAREAADTDLDQAIIQARWALLDDKGMHWSPPPPSRSLTERVDRVLLHPVAGLAVFCLIMGTMFQSLFSWSDPAIGLIEELVGSLGAAAAGALPPGVLTDLVVEGIIGGVGNVVVFLPQIILLFVFIGFLEASGYMARAAWLMDRLMRAVGLHGRAFVPMLSGFACAVPAIMATRTMERRRDRLLTMMVVPLMTCSARLPVYTLIIAALFPPDTIAGVVPVQGGLMLAMYLFSVLMALVSAAVLGRTVLQGPKVPLVMELPPYRMPRAADLAQLVGRRTKAFLSEAGTVILAFTVLMWGLLSFPALDEPPGGLDELPAAEASAFRARALEHSAAGRIGKAIEPTIAPLGFDWKIGVGLIGAFAAREVFVSTMGLVYGIGEEVDEETPALRDRIEAETHADGRPVYTPLTGLSLMVFFALAAQCMSTLAVVKRETNGYRWPAFLFAYMTALAWVASLVVYQGGRLLGFG